jgi:hypothetical protein
LCNYSRNTQNSMELEDSLPCSQEPSTDPYPKPDRSSSHIIPSYLSKIRFNFIYPPLRLGLPSGIFPSGFPANILHAFLFSPIRANCPAHPLLHPHHSYYIWRRVQLMKLLIMQFSLTSLHFISLRSKYSSQHPVLKHPQSMFFP